VLRKIFLFQRVISVFLGERKALSSPERELEDGWPDSLVAILTGLFMRKLNPISERVTSTK
jgi:hypothetical protein